MALKPLKDRVVAAVEKLLEKTKSGILLGEAKEKPAYAVVESVVEGGLKGGQVCAEGTPEDLAKSAKTPTGEYLKKYLAN